MGTFFFALQARSYATPSLSHAGFVSKSVKRIKERREERKVSRKAS